MTVPGTAGTSTPVIQQQGGELFRGFSALGNRVCHRSILYGNSWALTFGKSQLTDRLKEGGLENLISGVKNFLPANKLLPVTRLMEALMDSASASTQSLQETDDYLFLDPRAPRYSGGTGMQQQKGRRMAFGDGIVFVVGGAGYVEYGNLEEWAGRAGKRVTYGGTEILDPGGFMDVLERLGEAK